jgi:hypothetical protein
MLGSVSMLIATFAPAILLLLLLLLLRKQRVLAV